MLFSALLEVVSLSAVVPFLGMLVAPERVSRNSMIADVSLALGITSTNQLIFFFTVAFGFASLIAGVIRIILLWATTRIAFSSGADLGLEVYRRTLYQPYFVHVGRNSSAVISGITNKVNNVIFSVLLPLLTLVSSTVLLVAILFVLIAIDPMVATMSAIGFGAVYALNTLIFRQRLHRNSQSIANEQTQVIKALQEGLGGIRDVLLDGAQSVYCDIYGKADRQLRLAQGNNIFIGQTPRYVLETVGMLLIATLAYVLSRQPGGIATALPVLGAIALGAQRLLPTMQQIYYAWASIAGSHTSLVDIIDLLDQPLPADLLETAPAPLFIQTDIRFCAVRFRYASNSPWVLDGLNLTIPRGARVGFVGSTGSGKSTTLDVLMGLLMPTEGELLVDGESISGNRVRAWQQCIAHVPQVIYLADATLAENIAFGISNDAIDMGRVRQVARQAQIAEFIESSTEGYQAYVGERGIRLSGGQIQRIGIARALYKRASVLVFDEATSALDNATEKSVMDSIEGLSNSLTIILIAHRLSTVRSCDIIVELEHGRVVGQGTYEQLLEQSQSFKSMATI
jgi:ATP-binding cassette subfamily B protein